MHVLWLSLLVTVIWAEEQHYPQSNASTWDEARRYCQVCYKELSTVTSRNVHLLVQNLTVDHWIGLRRSFNGSIPWSRWSNGDPVTYQNWYPGHPIPKEKLPACSSDSNSTLPTVPANRTEDQCPLLTEIGACLNMTLDDLNIHFVNLTRPVVNTSHNLYSSPMPNITSNNTQNRCDPEPDLNPAEYIKDACVSLLSYGMWKEKQCYERLPFICYDERFFGHINISTKSESGGFLEWSNGPSGNVSHYRVEVRGDMDQNFTETNLFTTLVGLTAGTLYRVQVFPVKCGRDLNPQNISFYTLPLAIGNLSIDSVTTDSVKLNWSHSGNTDFFLIKMTDLQNTFRSKNSTYTVQNLTPGTNYSFTVAVVVNESTESVSHTVSTFTKPSTVRDLKSENTTCTDIKASWEAPIGGHSGYRYCLSEENECINCTACNCTEFPNSTDETQEIVLSNNTAGTKYFLCVAALINGEVGQATQTKAFTRPNPVTLILSESDQYINATWTLHGKFHHFNVSIEPPDMQSKFTGDLHLHIPKLKAAVYYTVKVITYAENGLPSEATTQSVYTLPTQPEWPKAIVLNQTAVNLTWGVPKESKGASNITYEVTYHSAYWGTSEVTNVTTENFIFANLKPGTTYTFNVMVVAGHLKSKPASVSEQTVPNKMTLTFGMLCSTEETLYCNNKHWNSTVAQLNNTFLTKYDGVHWKLKRVVRNE